MGFLDRIGALVDDTANVWLGDAPPKKPKPTYCETWGMHDFEYIAERDVLFCTRCGKVVKQER